MFSVIALQGSISAGVILLFGVTMGVFACAYRYVQKAGNNSFGAIGRGANFGTITIRSEQNVKLDDTARRLLGTSTGHISSVANLAALIADREPTDVAPNGRSAFTEALAALITSGTGFEILLRTLSGDLVVANGQPAGSCVRLRLRAATSQEKALATEVAVRAVCERRAKFLEAALERTGAPAVHADQSGTVLWQSAIFEALPDDAQTALLNYADNLEQAPDDHQFKTKRADGEPLHLSVLTTHKQDDQTVIVAKDISAQVEAETAFRRFVSTMSDTFAHLKISLMIFDAERRLTLFNPATVDMIRMDAVWLAQRPTLKVLLDRLREARMTPEQPNFIQWRDRLLKSTAHDPSDDNRGAAKQEDIWHLANGRTLMVLARPHPSGGLAVIIEDITDAMALRRQSVSERAVHIATTDVLQEALVLFAPDGAARFSNAAFQSLWSMEADKSIAGCHVRDIADHCRIHTADETFWDDLINSVTGDRRRDVITTKLVHQNGAIMMARISPVPDGSVLAVFSDITDSERIAAALTERNEALEQAQEMRIALIDQISHQMRNPLNSIFGFGQMLARRDFGELTEQQNIYVNGITAASNELLSAINGMTEIIDLDEDASDIPSGIVSVGHILADVAEIVNRRSTTDIVRLKPAPPPLAPAPIEAAAQRGHLRQIIFNMITDTLTSSSQTSPQIDPTRYAESEMWAEVSIGVDDNYLVITSRRRGDMETNTPTLALAMAVRLAKILKGAITCEEVDGWRVLHCRLPVHLIVENEPPNWAPAITQAILPSSVPPAR